MLGVPAREALPCLFFLLQNQEKRIKLLWSNAMNYINLIVPCLRLCTDNLRKTHSVDDSLMQISGSLKWG